MTTSQPAKIPLRIILAVLFLAVMWGGNTSAIKFSLMVFKPIAAAAIRFTFGLAVIISWAFLNKIPFLPQKSHLPRLLLLGIVFVVQIIAFNWGTKLTNAGRASLLLNTYPLLVALMSHFFIAGDRLDWLKSVGLITAFIGVFCIFSGEVGSTDVRIGDGMVLLSSLGLATINILLRRFMVPQSDNPTQPMNQFQTLFGQMVFGVPVYYILSWVFEGGTTAYKFSSLSACLGLIYQGTVVAGFCFIVWASILKQYPPGRLSSLFFTTPLWGMAFGHLFFQEPITSSLLIGAGLVAIGIYLVNR